MFIPLHFLSPSYVATAVVFVLLVIADLSHS